MAGGIKILARCQKGQIGLQFVEIIESQRILHPHDRGLPRGDDEISCQTADHGGMQTADFKLMSGSRERGCRGSSGSLKPNLRIAADWPHSGFTNGYAGAVGGFLLGQGRTSRDGKVSFPHEDRKESGEPQRQ